MMANTVPVRSIMPDGVFTRAGCYPAVHISMHLASVSLPRELRALPLMPRTSASKQALGQAHLTDWPRILVDYLPCGRCPDRMVY
jgi:hypothetical protein